MDKERINGYGMVLRFVTPVLITLVLYILTSVKDDIRELKLHFTNHLSSYQRNCVEVEGRLKSIETELILHRK